MSDYVLTRLASEAVNELTLWAEDLRRCDTEAQAVTYDLANAPVESARAKKNLKNDAIGTRVVVCEHVDHLARIRSVAATLIVQHQRDVKRRRSVKRSQEALDAWKATLKVTSRAELAGLVTLAAEYTRLV